MKPKTNNPHPKRHRFRMGLIATLATLMTLAFVPASPSSAQPSDVNNPYAGAKLYVNQDWTKNVQRSANRESGQLRRQMSKISRTPTAVWLDTRKAITGVASEGRRSLDRHLQTAVQQGKAANKPAAITIVIYNLPVRDCSASASNGEFQQPSDLGKYKNQYIDKIRNVARNGNYNKVRKIFIIEPDSLPNLVTNLSNSKCQRAESVYRNGVAYAINELSKVPNSYIYMDIGNNAWLGWDNWFQRGTALYHNLLKSKNLLGKVDGYATNVSNYSPVKERFFQPETQIAGQPARSAQFYSWNGFVDEQGYAQAWRKEMIRRGARNGIGMVIDTSRNGWGGSARPDNGKIRSGDTASSFVNRTRLDRRSDRGNWCNQAGAGMGSRPKANPANGIDAFMWIKPAGESDGVSRAGVPHPTKSFDHSCGSSGNTGALNNAPHAGEWFHSQFRMLVRNAHPAIR